MNKNDLFLIVGHHDVGTNLNNRPSYYNGMPFYITNTCKQGANCPNVGCVI